MLSRHALMSLLVVVGPACKGASKSEPAPPPAPVAAAASTGSAVGGASSSDAGSLDAPAPELDAPAGERAPAPAGSPPDDVLLVVSGLPDHARVIANRTGPLLESAAPRDGIFVGGYLVARHLDDPLPPSLAAWRGQKLALRDDTGVVCTATADSAVALRSGYFWGPEINWTRDPSRRDQLLIELWSGKPTGRTRTHESVFTAFALAGETAACQKAFFATPVDRKIKTTKVQAANADVESAAYAAFDSLGWVGNARSKAALEKLSGAEAFSVRWLDGGTGPSLVLVYANVNDRRMIAFWSVAPRSDPSAPPELVEIDALNAPAPSHVVGFDIDGDGAIDAVIGHDSGAAIVFNRGPRHSIAFRRPETYCPLILMDSGCAKPAAAEAPLY